MSGTPQAEPRVEILTPQQVNFFRTFGFLKVAGLYRDEIETIRAGFEEAWEDFEEPVILDPANPYHVSSHPGYEEKVREMVPFFLERSDKLSWMKDDPRMPGIARDLLGQHEYAESDGNRFHCDVYWHIDSYGARIEDLHLKMFFYLDENDERSGALRVLPGTNFYDEAYAQLLYHDLMAEPAEIQELFGVAIDEIPSWTVPVEPGDLVLGNYRTLHGSFGGPVGRRLMTVNWKQVLPA